MKKAVVHYIALLMIASTSCSSPRVISYAHPSANFDQYQTFSIKPHTAIEGISRKGHETYQQLDHLIANELTKRGYKQSHDADLIIEYEISSGLSQDTPSQYYDRYSWYYPSYSYSLPSQDIEAMVEILMIDTSSKKTVWNGSVDFTLRGRGDGNVERIEQHILEIFHRFQYSAP